MTTFIPALVVSFSKCIFLGFWPDWLTTAAYINDEALHHRGTLLHVGVGIATGFVYVLIVWRYVDLPFHRVRTDFFRLLPEVRKPGSVLQTCLQIKLSTSVTSVAWDTVLDKQYPLGKRIKWHLCGLCECSFQQSNVKTITEREYLNQNKRKHLLKANLKKKNLYKKPNKTKPHEKKETTKGGPLDPKGDGPPSGFSWIFCNFTAASSAWRV